MTTGLELYVQQQNIFVLQQISGTNEGINLETHVFIDFDNVFNKDLNYGGKDYPQNLI